MAVSQNDTRTTQASIALSHNPEQVVYVHLQEFTKSTTLFVTCQADSSTPAMGSFVYAMPDKYNPQPMCTTLYAQTGSIDFATRLAKLLARRYNRPFYVGSNSLPTTIMEEEMEVFQSVVRIVTQEHTAAT